MGSINQLGVRTFLGCTLLFALSLAWAQSKPADVRLLIDVSGSMELTDPHNLRRPAVDLLVRLLPEGGKAGIWTFGDEVQNLAPHQVVDEAWREKAQSGAELINSVSVFTHIGAALEQATYDREQPDAGYHTSVILLTDGMVDISRSPEVNQKEWRRIVDELLPAIRAAGYRVNTVALSDLADKDLMEKIAIDTDGVNSVVHNAEDLTKVFLNAFDTASPAQQVPLTDNRFVLDSSVNEFTALVFRQDPAEYTRLVSPAQGTYDHRTNDEHLRWHRTEAYDLITVTHPYEGAWRIMAAITPESRITVVTRMNLRVRPLPNNLFLGAEESLQFLLQEDGKPLTYPAFLSLLDIQAELTLDTEDGEQLVWQHSFPSDSPPADGVYRYELPKFERLGTYHLSLTIDGTTFQRQFKHTMEVREPFSATLEEALDDDGRPHSLLTVRYHGNRAMIQQTQLVATVVGPDRRRVVRPLALTPQDNWQVPLYLEQAGDYQVGVRVTGKDAEGEPFEYHLQPMSTHYDPDAAFAEPEPEPESEPELPPPAEPPEILPEPPVNGQPWILYGLLALVNLMLMGGGYWVYRKWIAESDESQSDEEAVPESSSPPEPIPDDDMNMDMDFTEDDEEPPMEDLDLSDGQESFDETDMPDMNDPEEEPSEMDQEPDDDSSPHKLEEELMQLVTGDDASEEERDSFSEDMLKAQGLDLAEHELDDAIYNLINELDGGGSASKRSAEGEGENLQDDDMGADEMDMGDMDMDNMDMEKRDSDDDDEKPDGSPKGS